MENVQLLVYLLFGLIGGVLSGLLGVGGGIIFIPVFDHVFRSMGIEGEELVRYILANSFLSILFAGVSSSFKHHRMGNFHLKEVLTIAIPAIITGTILTRLITHASWYKVEYFKAVFIAVIAVTLWRQWSHHKKRIVHEPRPFSYKTYGAIGLVTGLISAISGLGGGIAMIPLLTLFARLDIKKASAISISVIPIMVVPFLITYARGLPEKHFDWSVGYLQFMLILPVVVGVLIGSPLGVRLAHKLNSRTLQLIFAILLIVIIIREIVKLIH
ncbi:MAG: TSUP family transporter [Bacteroidetes bacterium]|nr:TSUP family transporter [Bacteroidota bacterium]